MVTFSAFALCVCACMHACALASLPSFINPLLFCYTRFHISLFIMFTVTLSIRLFKTTLKETIYFLFQNHVWKPCTCHPVKGDVWAMWPYGPTVIMMIYIYKMLYGSGPVLRTVYVTVLWGRNCSCAILQMRKQSQRTLLDQHHTNFKCRARIKNQSPPDSRTNHF